MLPNHIPNKIKSAVVLLLLSATQLYAQAPKYSNEFLMLGVGARAMGMAGAQVSHVSDVTAGYWNPAGLNYAKGDLQFALMHSEYFAGIAKYDYGAFAAPIDSMRHVGLSIIRFAIDDIPNTIELVDEDGNLDYDRITTFSAADYAFLFSYAQRTKIIGLTYGANLKVIHRKVGDFAKAWGFGLDAGLQFEKNRIKLGAFAKDVTSTFNAWSYSLDDKTKEVFTQTGNEIPENGLEITLPRLIFGASYKATLLKKFTVLPALDFDLTFDGKRNTLLKSKTMSLDPKLGLEIGYNNFVFLRGGINNIQEVTDIDGSTNRTVQPNFGVGVKIKGLSIDYALTNIGNDQNLYSNVFSLRLIINKQKKA